MNEESAHEENESDSKEQETVIDIKGCDLNEKSEDTVTQPITAANGNAPLQCTNPEKSTDHVEIEISEIPANTSPVANVLHSNNKCEPQVFVNRPLCADYRSDTDSDTDSDSDSDSDPDSNSESSTLDSDSDSSSSDSSLNEEGNDFKEKKQKVKEKQNVDLSLSDLPPIENLKISVPEEECQEIGSISSIVGTLVVVEAYKNTPALDIDTVLFLDKGQKSLGKVFDVLGPVSEPIYTVRFNNEEEIRKDGITKGLKVYCAPRTEYTSLVFVSQLMKMRGSDASWKNNEEAPLECQDFSDDEEERKFKKGGESAQNSEQPLPSSDVLSRKKTKVHRPRPNQNCSESSNNQRFRIRPPRLVPPSGSNAWAPVPHHRRFSANPPRNPVQLPYTNPAYHFPPQFHNGPGFCSPRYLRPGCFPNFPQPFRYQQYAFPATNPFILPPPGPPPLPPPEVVSNKPQNPVNNSTRRSSDVTETGVDNPL